MIGWNINNYGEGAVVPTNQKLKQASVKVYDFNECRKMWKDSADVTKDRKPISKSHVCAGPTHIFEVILLKDRVC